MTFARDVLAGLRATPQTLPCKYFYDARGSELFEHICELDAYYLTRTELEIMHTDADAIAAAIGADAVIIEFGSGSGSKARLLLESLHTPRCYAPIEICREALQASAAELSRRFPQLAVVPTNADYTTELSLDLPDGGRRVVYFPGSTIGNFESDEVAAFLRRVAQLVGPGGGFLVGVDLVKDPAILLRAYDDEEGVTAEFNLNVMHRINRELAADIDVRAFRHEARYRAEVGRVEMHLVCARAHEATVAGERVAFRAGESIHTENSQKYTLDGFADLCAAAGLEGQVVWLDDERLVSLQYFEVKQD